MTLHEIRNEIRQRLAPFVGNGEADAMAKLILEEIKGYSPVELVIHSNRELQQDTITLIRQICDRVAKGEPLQYVLGKTWWHGRKFMVNPSVLIPRPETSQLVDIIEEENKNHSDLDVLDIGTGSGCIAITLALDLPYSHVTAIDISGAALDTASANAKALKTKVEFLCIDGLSIASSRLAACKYDIIVSNPPYVLESERDGMDPRVKDHEPPTALFVNEGHSLSLYNKIIDFASSNLKEGGKLYLEINPLLAEAIKQALRDAGLENAEIIRDYKGTYRFAKATHR